MPDNGKVTLSEAANAIGVHYNTIRNWRKAGLLHSAEKVIQSGNETWIVSLEEVQHIARQRAMITDYSPPQSVNATGPATDTPTPDNSPPQAAISPVDVQTLANLLETTVKSLTEALERRDSDFRQVQETISAKDATIADLRAQVARLEERLRLLETSRQETPSAPERTESTPDVPQNTPRKKRWWQL